MNPKNTIPRSLEVLIKKAAVDDDFCLKLKNSRSDAAADIGLELNQNEKLILNQIPVQQLEKIIAETHVPTEHLSIFRGQIAALMLMALGAVSIPALANDKELDKDERAKLQKEIKKLIEENKNLELENHFLYKQIKRSQVYLGIRPNRKEKEEPFIQKKILWEQLQGKVLKVNEKWNFIVIDLGLKNKIKLDKKEVEAPLKKGWNMYVMRDDKIIAQATVVRVNDMTGVCEITDKEDTILPGDKVKIANFGQK